MLTVEFSHERALGKLKYANARQDAFNRALIIRKLGQVYGDVSVSLKSSVEVMNSIAGSDVPSELAVAAKLMFDPVFQANFNMGQDFSKFADVAVRVVELHADGLDSWIALTDLPTAIDAAFQHYLANEDVWQFIADRMAEMDRPNGVEGALPEQLTEIESKDPLSSNGAKNTREVSLTAPKSEPGKSTKTEP